MAFIAFDVATALQYAPNSNTNRSTITAPQLSLSQPIHETPSVLSEVELRIVDLARTDGLNSLKPRRKRGWLLRLVLGASPPSLMLSNKRLEALRRVAIYAWQHGYTIPVSVLKDAQELGNSEAKIGAVMDTIARNREPFRRLAA